MSGWRGRRKPGAKWVLGIRAVTYASSTGMVEVYDPKNTVNSGAEGDGQDLVWTHKSIKLRDSGMVKVKM